MAVVATWDGATRRIYLASGVTTFHPIDDIYREYRAERRTNEAFRKWAPFMEAAGNEPKGGGKFTARFLRLLGGAKIVPFDEAVTIDVTGEVLTDDQTDPFDYSTQTTPTIVRYAPAEAEVITIAGGSGLDAGQDATLTQAAIDAAAAAADAATAKTEAELARKLIDADETLSASGVWTLIDADDGVTTLRTRQVLDKDGNAITLAVGAPARRTKV